MLATSIVYSQHQSVTTQGTEFWAAFLRNGSHDTGESELELSQTGETAINLAAGNYMVTVTDDLKLDRPVFEVMRILGSSLLVQDSLSELFKQNDAKVLEDGQLELDFLC